ncbi:MAG TPA: recombinase family protein [Candidatus Tectomicrobia bacterium]
MRRKVSTTSTPQAIAYVRVSTPGQRDEGVSLDAQRSKITAWCGVMGYELVATYADEGLSGHSMDKRPGLHQATSAACTRGCVLVVYSLSRLARNTRETLELGETFAQAGADIVSLSENIDTTSAAGKMVFRMLAVLAEFERDQISERTSMGMAYKRQQGQRISRHIPYGQQLSADGVHLEPNAAEQKVIAVAKELHAAGLSSRKIAAELDARGMRSRVGTAFGSTAILGMVV